MATGWAKKFKIFIFILFSTIVSRRKRFIVRSWTCNYISHSGKLYIILSMVLGSYVKTREFTRISMYCILFPFLIAFFYKTTQYKSRNTLFLFYRCPGSISLISQRARTKQHNKKMRNSKVAHVHNNILLLQKPSKLYRLQGLIKPNYYSFCGRCHQFLLFP